MKLNTIGANGEISLGKQHAGRTVTVEELEDGVWLVKVIPESELWIHREPAKSTIDRAVEWAEKNSPEVSDLDKLRRGLKKPSARGRRLANEP